MPESVKDYCADVYSSVYEKEKERMESELLSVSRSGALSATKLNDIEKAAQKEAIKQH